MSRSTRHEVCVRCSLEHAFDTFTARIELWWPRSHRRFEGSELRLQPEAGGRFFERAPSGEERDLGEVLRWEPPHRLTYSWWPGAVEGPTHVDVRFVAEDDGTRVVVLHREGDTTEWEERVALFDRAWAAVLPAFTQLAEDRAP